MNKVSAIAMFSFGVALAPSLAQTTVSLNSSEPTTTVLSHGSVGVLISTKDGFVLAADSRLTREDGNRDNGRKLYTIGNDIACVIAGAVEAEVHSGTPPYQFELRDALGSHLLNLDEVARQGGPVTSAKDVIPAVAFGVSRILGLAQGNSSIQAGPFVEAICASVASDGSREWIRNDVPIIEEISGSERTFKVGFVRRKTHSDTTSFDFDVIGQKLIPHIILGADVASDDPHTRTPVLLRFYQLKRMHRLNEFTLKDAVLLAREMVQATIDLSNEDAGVGGPIDIATITQGGVRWIQRKCDSELLPRTHLRIYDSRLTLQTLGNIECVRCDFTNARLFYAGDADVQLVDARLGGSCRLAIAPDADKKNPQALAKLKSLVQGHCRVVVQQGNFP